jgi:SNF2 family DNA or RNA helicase
MSDLWRHQREAIEFARSHFARDSRGVMFAMWMGTGKTRTVIELANQLDVPKLLVLCPLRVVEVWGQQLARYAPGRYEFLGLGARTGSVANKARRAAILLEWAKEREGRRVAIAVNYEAAKLGPFASWSLNETWPFVVADESHRCKAASSVVSKYLGQLGLRTRYRVALTGTPMPHSPLDIWGQYRFLNPSIYDLTFTSFKARYAVFDDYFKNKIVGWRNLQELRERYAQIAFEVGAEVLDLPEEMDQTFYAEFDHSAQRLYNQMEATFIAWVEATGSAITADNAGVRLLRLQQIAAGTVRDENKQDHIVSTAKENLLQDLIEDLAPEEPVVVFARFRPDLAAIHRTAQRLGRKSAELSGDSHPSELERWKRGDKNDPVILAAQIQAGSEGIDLTRARFAIYYSTGFSLGIYLQSRSRIKRPGQTRPVVFYHLVVHNTVDEYVIAALNARQNLIDIVLHKFKEKKTCPASP